jgi:hypothetical protein
MRSNHILDGVMGLCVGDALLNLGKNVPAKGSVLGTDIDTFSRRGSENIATSVKNVDLSKKSLDDIQKYINAMRKYKNIEEKVDIIRFASKNKIPDEYLDVLIKSGVTDEILEGGVKVYGK